MLYKLILIFCTILISAIGFSQQRISLELSSRLTNISVGLNYHKVVRNHFLFGAGILFGGKMRGYTPVSYSQDQLLNRSPFPVLNQLHFEDTNTYELVGHYVESRSLNALFNLGYFHNFDQVHGLRINSNFRVGYADAKVSIRYRNIDNQDNTVRHAVQRFYLFAFSPEIFHTIRQSSKFTFFYGLKFPIFMNLTPEVHKPQFISDAYYKCKPELVGGISYAFGRCD